MRFAYWPVLCNVLGLAFAFLYGISGGSGGETTEGVFMAFWVTGWITILTAFLVLGWLLLRKKAQLPDILLIAIMAVVGFLETRLITSNPAALQGLFH